MITFKKEFSGEELVRLFEPGSAKWVELYTNQHDEPAARFQSTKENSTVLRADEVTGKMLDRHNIDWYDVVVYPAHTVGTSV